MEIAVKQNTKTKRVDFTLPLDTLILLEQTVPRGKKSELVNKALQVYIRHLNQKKLRTAMKKEALADIELDKQTTQEWSSIDDETWPE